MRELESATIDSRSGELQQRVTRARVEYRKLLEFDGLSEPLWIGRALLPIRRAQESRGRDLEYEWKM